MSTSAAKPARRRGLRWVALATALGAVGGGVLLFAGPASANATTVKAQLSFSGIATQASPAGGSVVGIHPGDSVVFAAATIPTAGLDALGIGDAANNLLGGLLGYQVNLDASKLPGGTSKVVLTSSSAYKITFPTAGTYTLNWTASNLLGVINLNGNELQKAGIAFNAQTGWSASIVVADNPPAGGLAIQLPSVGVTPSLPIVGQLSGINLPGVTTPTLGIGVPTLPSLPGSGGSSSPTGGSTGNTGTETGATGDPITVPQKVVPADAGGALSSETGSFTGLFGTFPTTGSGGTTSGSSGTTGTSIAPSAPVTISPPPGSVKPSADPLTSHSGAKMPVILAILAILALSLVAATYARLYLIRRESA